jgi:hypothetical protein
MSRWRLRAPDPSESDATVCPLAPIRLNPAHPGTVAVLGARSSPAVAWLALRTDIMPRQGLARLTRMAALRRRNGAEMGPLMRTAPWGRVQGRLGARVGPIAAAHKPIMRVGHAGTRRGVRTGFQVGCSPRERGRGVSLPGSRSMDRPIIAGNVWSRSAPRPSTTPAPAAHERTAAFTPVHDLLQNWRGGVSLVVTDAARIIEWVQYSAYGAPFGIPAGNASSNGTNNVEDLSTLINWINNIVWDARWDLNADGSITTADYASYPEKTLGRGKLSWINNRIGYAAYQHAPELAGTKYLLRHRWLLADLGVFNRRDPHPQRYMDGMNDYAYSMLMPLLAVDPSGLSFSRAVAFGASVQVACGVGTPAFAAGLRTWCGGGGQGPVVPGGPTGPSFPGPSVPNTPGCGPWDSRNPPPIWTIPQVIPPTMPPEYLPEITRRCSGYLYPPGMMRQDCACWEKRRILDIHGVDMATKAKLCAESAESMQTIFSDAQCRNDMRHCTFACCLGTSAAADDILWAHECCDLHTSPVPDWEDYRNDVHWNGVGRNCATTGSSQNESCASCCYKRLRRKGCILSQV